MRESHYLDDKELWWEKQNLLWLCHTSRKKDRMNIDGTFRPHQDGAISATFTSDWYQRKGESRDKMGEWLKKTTVRFQDSTRTTTFLFKPSAVSPFFFAFLLTSRDGKGGNNLMYRPQPVTNRSPASRFSNSHVVPRPRSRSSFHVGQWCGFCF
jgi:hypothetical protein